MASGIQQLIDEADAGDPRASEQLFAALYDELHRLAEVQLHRRSGSLSLGTTTLLHEAYLRLADREGVRFASRGHFLGYAAHAMRGLVIDYVRRSRAQKRGGGAFELTFVEDQAPAAGAPGTADDRGGAAALERLSDALDELAAVEPALAQLVDLHFFCGFSFLEIASLRGVSDRTVRRDWRKARLFLHDVLQDGEEG